MTALIESAKNVQPAPFAGRDNKLLGLAFDKRTPCNLKANSDTFGGTLENPTDCRWADCYPKRRGGQQTVAIYVR